MNLMRHNILEIQIAQNIQKSQKPFHIRLEYSKSEVSQKPFHIRLEYSKSEVSQKPFHIRLEYSKSEKKRVIPTIVTFQEECDYLAYHCLEIYKTGLICAKTMYQRYRQFRNYCELDYINCRERYDVWTIAYMGPCLNKIEPATNYTHYEYLDDFFLDNYYVIQE
ncbi:hypothetical protein K1T71_013755 [Dendrolimus kikuchii]|uniref:Uncharacterized protein n=1 Tax=Dendrolimus kikuchii TaxID=765133 RepID=A0ACC1CHI3_9NEOP|nr:hypothetical protein K1T71_013755 [Dendrolimus kikuchii]